MRKSPRLGAAQRLWTRALILAVACSGGGALGTAAYAGGVCWNCALEWGSQHPVVPQQYSHVVPAIPPQSYTPPPIMPITPNHGNVVSPNSGAYPTINHPNWLPQGQQPVPLSPGTVHGGVGQITAPSQPSIPATPAHVSPYNAPGSPYNVPAPAVGYNGASMGGSNTYSGTPSTSAAPSAATTGVFSPNPTFSSGSEYANGMYYGTPSISASK